MSQEHLEAAKGVVFSRKNEKNLVHLSCGNEGGKKSSWSCRGKHALAFSGGKEL